MPTISTAPVSSWTLQDVRAAADAIRDPEQNIYLRLYAAECLAEWLAKQHLAIRV